jgi:hypothetical protein
MTHPQASNKLRAVAVALQDTSRGIRPRTAKSFAWAFGPQGRVAMLWVAPGSSSSDEFQIHVTVDAQSDRDREAPATIFDKRSSTENIVHWVLDKLFRL